MAKAALAPITNYQWNLLQDSPAASSRTDDIWFFDEKVGWLVNSSGYVAKTDDGGQFWQQKFFVYPGLPSSGPIFTKAVSLFIMVIAACAESRQNLVPCRPKR